MDRGWYAGPVGWMDATEDGEFCVALRSALLRDREAHLFAGVGVVAGSDPAAELAETEVKLQALCCRCWRTEVAASRALTRAVRSAAERRLSTALRRARRCSSTLAWRSDLDLDQAGAGGEGVGELGERLEPAVGEVEERGGLARRRRRAGCRAGPRTRSSVQRLLPGAGSGRCRRRRCR